MRGARKGIIMVIINIIGAMDLPCWSHVKWLRVLVSSLGGVTMKEGEGLGYFGAGMDDDQ